MSETDFIPARLPSIFRPVIDVPLVRIGRANDGGYLIDRRNIEQTDILIGMGMSDDWSFEEQFLAQHNVPLVAYDASVSTWEFVITLYKKVVLFEPINTVTAFKVLLGYLRFFNRTTRVHRRKFVGYSQENKGISYATLLQDDVGPDRHNIFFKIDIEGAEYNFLNDLVASANRIEGLVIEFHDVDRNMTRITNFIRSFPLALCHVHTNNSSKIVDDGTPTFIECSFTRHSGTKVDNVQLPHPLDMPCRTDRPEIATFFAD